jgi:hypothetical protein
MYRQVMLADISALVEQEPLSARQYRTHQLDGLLA